MKLTIENISIKPVVISDIEGIINLVSNEYKKSRQLMFSKSRKQELVESRQVIMYLALKYTKLTTVVIGKKIGDRDHSTVLHACKKVSDIKDTDPCFSNMLDKLERNIFKTNLV